MNIFLDLGMWTLRIREVTYLAQGRCHLPCTLLSLYVQEQCRLCNTCSTNIDYWLHRMIVRFQACMLSFSVRASWPVSTHGLSPTFLLYRPHIGPSQEYRVDLHLLLTCTTKPIGTFNVFQDTSAPGESEMLLSTCNSSSQASQPP